MAMGYQKANEASEALAEMLGYEDSYMGHINDEAVDGGNFDRGMEKEGFIVKTEKKGRRK